MDAPCGPLALPPQGVDLGDQDRIELGRLTVRPAGQVLKAGFSLGAVAGDPSGHRGPAHPELGGHVCLRDPVVQVAVDHPETAGVKSLEVV